MTLILNCTVVVEIDSHFEKFSQTLHYLTFSKSYTSLFYRMQGVVVSSFSSPQYCLNIYDTGSQRRSCHIFRKKEHIF
jgi:hypothetical protein